MQASSLSGGFADAPRDAAHAFRGVMRAMACPGQIQTVQGAQPPAPVSRAAGVVLLTLCDPETPIFLAPGHDTPALRDWIGFHTGAPIVEAGEAMFALGTWEALPLVQFTLGTSEYPDRSATLIVEVADLTNSGATLRGPGIQDSAQLSLPELPAFQRNRALFPLGLDFLFTCGDRVAGLPRSTRVA